VDTGRDFIGSQAVSTLAEKLPARRRVSLESPGHEESRIFKLGDTVSDAEGREIGAITSAAPTVEKSIIAQAYIDSAAAEPGAEVTVAGENARLTGVHA